MRHGCGHLWVHHPKANHAKDKIIDKALREKAEAKTAVATTVTVDIGEIGVEVVEVKEASVKTDFKVRTPDFTISIRGSHLDHVWAYEIGSAAAMRVHTYHP